MLSKLSQSEDFPHLLFYGPSGSGKRTLTKGVLQALYGSNSVHKIKMTPSEADQHDRVIVQKLIKEVAGSQQLDSKQQKPFKVVVIHELDQLSQTAQASLRRTMETYMPTCRIIANCESLSKVITPLKSRCLQIRVPAPKEQVLAELLSKIAQKEKFELPEQVASQIAHHSRRNIRRAIMMLQTLKLKTNNLHSNTQVPRPDYEGFIAEIATDVVREQTPQNLRSIRTKLYELLTKGITSDVIFQQLAREFLKPQKSSSTLPEQIKPTVLQYAVMFEGRCREGSKPIIHLEAFLARVMSLIKNAQAKRQ